MKLETKEQCLALTDEQINKLTGDECEDALDLLHYNDSIYEKICMRLHRTRAIRCMNCKCNLTIGKIRDLIKDLNDDDFLEIYDTYNETTFEPDEMFVSEEKDENGKSHVFLMLNTD